MGVCVGVATTRGVGDTAVGGGSWATRVDVRSGLAWGTAGATGTPVAVGVAVTVLVGTASSSTPVPHEALSSAPSATVESTADLARIARPMAGRPGDLGTSNRLTLGGSGLSVDGVADQVCL